MARHMNSVTNPHTRSFYETCGVPLRCFSLHVLLRFSFSFWLLLLDGSSLSVSHNGPCVESLVLGVAMWEVVGAVRLGLGGRS